MYVEIYYVGVFLSKFLNLVYIFNIFIMLRNEPNTSEIIS